MSGYKKRMVISFVLALALSLMPVQFQVSDAAGKMSLNKSTCVVKKGAKLKLKAKGLKGKEKKKLTWKSSNKKVATVSKKGVVKAKKKGTAVIRAKAGKKSASCKVTVGVPVKKVKVNAKEIRLTKGQSAKIKASVSPSNASVKKLGYVSKNKKVASVDSKGKVSALSAGTTSVTVKSKDGNNKSAKVKVIVTDELQKPRVDTTAPAKKVAVTGFALSQEELLMDLNETSSLQTVFTPANATNKNVTWTSTNPSVASVSATGIVRGISKGNAVIEARTEDGGFTAKCSVTVASLARVSSDDEIASALEQGDFDILLLESSAKTKFTVPEGDYRNAEMIVRVPNGEVENNANFKTVHIEEIAKDTYYENATGNLLSIESADSHVVIGRDALASVQVTEGSKNAGIENNGTLEQLDIVSDGSVRIFGEGDEIIPVSITKKVKLVTNQNLQITAVQTTFELQIRSGAENTTVTVDKKENRPSISGLGMITVTYVETGDVETIVSSYDTTNQDARDVDFKGLVKNQKDEPLQGAEVYLLPYQEQYDLTKIETDPNAMKMTTDAEGVYAQNTVKTGNYILYAAAEGYAPVTQVLVITSTYGEIYTNEAIQMMPMDWVGKSGGVSGTIIDSLTGDVVPELTIRIRQDKNNLTGDAVKETTTDGSGKYIFEELPVGYYTVQVIDNREGQEGDIYLPTSFNVLITPDTVTEGQGTGVSKAILSGQVRFILTWGTEESGAIADADSHLVGPLPEDGWFHTYFSDQTALYGEEKYADLDLDDTDYQGPETTTIYRELPGTYSFYVHDYTNMDSLDSSRLAESDVKVEVYTGSFKQATYYVPNQEGTLWHVCDYNSATKSFKTVNEMSYHPGNVGDIGLTVDMLRSRIQTKLGEIADYAALLEEGTDADIQEKLENYGKESEQLDSQAELSELYREASSYLEQLQSECYYYISGDNVYDYDRAYTDNKPYIYTTDGQFNEEGTEFFFENGEAEEVTPEDPKAVKAFRVTCNGHTRVLQFYVTFSLRSVNVKKVTNKGKDVAFWTGWYYTEEDDEYETIELPEDYSLEDLKVEFSVDGLQPVYAVDPETGMDSVTLTVGNSKRIWLIVKKTIPVLEDPGNEIVKTLYSSGYAYVFGENEHLSDNCTVKFEGEVLETEVHDSGNFQWMEVGLPDDRYYSIYYYPVSKVCSLSEVYYYDEDYDEDVYGVIDEEAGTVTFTGTEEEPSEYMQNLYSVSSVGSDLMDIHCVKEFAEGEDYYATITVSADEFPDSTRTYKVYYSQT